MKRRKREAPGDGEGFKNVYYKTIMTKKKMKQKKWMTVEEELTGGFKFKMKKTWKQSQTCEWRGCITVGTDSTGCSLEASFKMTVLSNIHHHHTSTLFLHTKYCWHTKPTHRNMNAPASHHPVIQHRLLIG